MEHSHAWAPDFESGSGWYLCTCGAKGRRSLIYGTIGEVTKTRPRTSTLEQIQADRERAKAALTPRPTRLGRHKLNA